MKKYSAQHWKKSGVNIAPVDVTAKVGGSFESGGNLTLQSTSHATKGKILFGTSAYDEVNNRLGIGTVSPLTKLDVNGSVRATGSATSVLTGSIDPTVSTSVTGVGTLFLSELVIGDRITVSGQTRTVTSISSDTALTVELAFADNANDTSVDKLPAIFTARASGVSGMTINGIGNVGFGTVFPVFPLEASKNNTGQTTLFGVRNTHGVAADTADIDFMVTASTLATSGRIGATRTNRGVSGDSDMTFSVSGAGTLTERMRIMDNGNVGIGTAAPTSRIHGVTTLSAATGNEIAYQLNYTTNKATSGNDTGLLINQTDTASPGTSYLIDAQVGGVSKFKVDNTGNQTNVGTMSASGFLVGATAGIDATVTYVDTLLGAKTLTFTKGILTAQT